MNHYELMLQLKNATWHAIDMRRKHGEDSDEYRHASRVQREASERVLANLQREYNQCA